MNILNSGRRAAILASLVEGNSVRSTCRMTGVAKGTVLKLLADVGTASAGFQDRALRNLSCRRLQCDEIWAFCYAKERNLPPSLKGRDGFGSVWTWTALDADTKLIPTWHVGGRGLDDARIFMRDLASRLACRVQLTTDGHSAYVSAVVESFPWIRGHGVDYGILMKHYGPSGNDRQPETRYSPGRLIRAEKRLILGDSDERHISTSFVERSNLTLRMANRRFTRLTNGFSKKVENLKAALALHFLHYNFCRKHQTLGRLTPAMAAGVADHVWSLQEVLDLLDSN